MQRTEDRKVALGIRDTVNYTTSINGVTLDNWKVFYVDGNYTTEALSFRPVISLPYNILQ